MKTRLDQQHRGDHGAPIPEPGYSVWLEGDTYYTAETVSGKVYGRHNYTQSPSPYGSAFCICGCWTGKDYSGGPVDPDGPCPGNPLPAPTMEDRISQHEEAQQKIFGQTKPKLCVDCKWHGLTDGVHVCRNDGAYRDIVTGSYSQCHLVRDCKEHCGIGGVWFEPRTVSGVWHQKPIPTSPQEKPLVVPPELARGDWDKSVAHLPTMAERLKLTVDDALTIVDSTNRQRPQPHEVICHVLADEVRRLRSAEQCLVTTTEIKAWNAAICTCISTVYDSTLIPAANRHIFAARLRQRHLFK